MPSVLLINMPFSNATDPSMGLSILKPALKKVNINSKILYLNITFRAYSRDYSGYDIISGKHWLGEWIFGPELYGSSWAGSDRGGRDYLKKQLKSRNDLEDQDELIGILSRFRLKAGPFLDHCLEAIDFSAFDIIGFTSLFSQQVASLALARRIKKHYPEKIIAFGGANCKGDMGKALLEYFDCVDWVFDGDADYSFPRAVLLQQSGDSLASVEGLYYREKGKLSGLTGTAVTDLDSLPLPDYDEHFNTVSKEAPDLAEKVHLHLELSRGCWKGFRKQCTFCGLNADHLCYRSKEPARALGEIDTLTRRYRNKNIKVVDNILDRKYYRTLLPDLSAKKLDAFTVEVPSSLSFQDLLALKNAGTRLILPGVENLDSELLRYMNKGTNMLLSLRFLKWCRELGLYPRWNFMHTFPGEKAEPYRRVARLVPLLTHLQPPGYLLPVHLQRFSLLFNFPEQFGIDEIMVNPCYKWIYPFEEDKLFRLAYSFEYEEIKYGIKETQTRLVELEKALDALESWQSLWQAAPVPTLIYEVNRQGQVTLYDRRVHGKKAAAHLSQLQSFIIQACDRDVSFDVLSQKVREEYGGPSPGQKELRNELITLTEEGYLVSENKRYLNLALDLRRLVKYNSEDLPIDLVYLTL